MLNELQRGLNDGVLFVAIIVQKKRLQAASDFQE